MTRERKGQVEVYLDENTGAPSDVLVVNDSGRVVLNLAQLSGDEVHARYYARGLDPDLRLLIRAERRGAGAVVVVEYAWEEKPTPVEGKEPP